MNINTYIKRGIQYIFRGVPQKYLTAQISYLSPNKRLQGKRIIITGGGRGLGAAMCNKFVQEGAKVLISGRNEKSLMQQAEKVGCLCLPMDVCNVEECASFIEQASLLLGGLDCLVNNAGISLHEGSILNVSSSDFDAQISTNLRGGYFLAQQFIKQFESTNGTNGNILFISSERGCFVDDLPYGLTKAATNSLVQGLAYFCIKRGIRVNALSPGVTTSDMTGFKADGNLLCDYNMTGRVYLPEEVAEIACFLLSDASKCLNGQILVCNEGKSINNKR